MTITLKSKSLRGEVDLRSVVWESGGHLFVYYSDSLLFSLSGNVAEMVATLRSAAEQLEAQSYTGTEKALIRGDAAEPIKRFGFVKIDDIASAPTYELKLALLIERFTPTLPDIAEALRADYKSLTGKQYDGSLLREEDQPAPAPSQLAADLQVVRGLASEWFAKWMPGGQWKYGHQTAIANALSIRNAGETHRKRIEAVARAVWEESTERKEKAA